ncbi:PIG-L family deacetylase [Candidatus Woesearchaeota archaeon]|nr:PIG-L family deacetylase [Candidatus Woesearchaeota archaeon]
METVLLFCAHPDDEILGAGATLAKYAGQGKQVLIAIFSYGESSHLWLQKQVTVQMRIHEAKEASRAIGATRTIFLGAKDMDIQASLHDPVFLDKVKQLIQRHKPVLLFTHSKFDAHKDHQAVHSIVMTALDQLNSNCPVYGFRIWASEIQKKNVEQLVVDCSSTFPLKRKAYKCFKSQHFYIAQLYAKSSFKGWWEGLKYNANLVETFDKIR